jgi:hypothetical protein
MSTYVSSHRLNLWLLLVICILLTFSGAIAATVQQRSQQGVEAPYRDLLATRPPATGFSTSINPAPDLQPSTSIKP